MGRGANIYAASEHPFEKALATELGISHQALSERLRRAIKNLVKSSLLVDEDDEN